jgi:deoxyribonuclease-4
MWRASTPGVIDVALLRRARRKFDLKPLAIHVNYLINLAAVDPEIRAKSIAGFRGELERAEIIGAEYLVLHPGSYKNQTLQEGIAALASGLESAAAGLGPLRTTVLLENTVGCGAQIGGRFEELRAIRDLVPRSAPFRIGYCLDTCHLLGSGYDIATAAGLARTVREAGRILGLRHVKMFHANDSKAPLSSHLDRHENIGQGYIGIQGFRRILAHPKLRSKPFILETPVDEEGDDRRNLETLKRLCPKSRTTITRSS